MPARVLIREGVSQKWWWAVVDLCRTVDNDGAHDGSFPQQRCVGIKVW